MAFFKRIKNKGFSLLEVMIGGAIMTGVALVGAQLFKAQKQGLKSVDHMQNLQSFHQSLTKQLINPLNCNATFSASWGRPSIADITQIQTCSGSCDIKTDAQGATGVRFVAENSYTDATQVWQISSINVSSPAGTGAKKTGPMKVTITYLANPRLAGKIYGSVNKDIIVNVRFDAAGNFRECFNDQKSAVDNLQSDVCYTLGGQLATTGAFMKWNPDTQSCERIDPNVYCSTKGLTLKGISSDGLVHCTSLSDQIDESLMFNPNTVNCAGSTQMVLKYNSTSGKMRLECL